MEEFEGSRVPVYSWAPDLEAGARAQALRCTELSVAFHHVAVMADGHQGYGVPIGAVLAFEAALSPFAVGNDIGCGMAIVPTDVKKGDILGPVPTRAGGAGPPARDEIMGWVQSSVPSGNEAHRDRDRDTRIDEVLERAFDAMTAAAAVAGIELSTSQSPDGRGGVPLEHGDFVHRGRTQLGTLGSGNHFLELLADEDERVWLMVHSGSRGIGGAICNNFHRMALTACRETGVPLPDPGLAWLPVEGQDRWSEVGRAYERALRAGLEYAHRNRHEMLAVVASIVERRFPDTVRWRDTVNIHHNDATLEVHFGHEVWVHRKGAVKAASGTTTITPGSMGTATYLGEGLGNSLSFESCSHGAGRARSRGRARAELSLQRELEIVAATGGKVFATNKEAVLDEMPGAYKDLDEVMANQRDLVRVTARLRPLATYKGTDTGGRRRGRVGRKARHGKR